MDWSSSLLAYFGNLHRVFSPVWADGILVLVSVLCGLIIGQERESKNKPAGLRTVTLICVGSTIFTLVSILIVAGSSNDPGRIAAQVVTGIGFLGAGAIIREHGTIVGLTTAATIWVTAAIGVVIGSGYAVAGVALTLVVVGTLLGARWIEEWLLGPCKRVSLTIRYRADGAKTHLRVLRILDEFHVPDTTWSITREGDLEVLRINCCVAHRSHRAFLFEIAELGEVESIDPAPIWHTCGHHKESGLTSDM
jgi:putative Mg2+ transporter-C (MgtC) family protein